MDYMPKISTCKNIFLSFIRLILIVDNKSMKSRLVFKITANMYYEQGFISQ